MSGTATTPVTEILNYIDSAWRKSLASEFMNVTNPAAGELFGHIPISQEADVDAGGLRHLPFAGMTDECATAAVKLESRREESPLS